MVGLLLTWNKLSTILNNNRPHCLEAAAAPWNWRSLDLEQAAMPLAPGSLLPVVMAVAAAALRMNVTIIQPGNLYRNTG